MNVFLLAIARLGAHAGSECVKMLLRRLGEACTLPRIGLIIGVDRCAVPKSRRWCGMARATLVIILGGMMLLQWLPALRLRA